jgi:Icc-related predicted phosphoesterase
VKGTKRFSSRPRKFTVALDGEGIANHVGCLALRELIDSLASPRPYRRLCGHRSDRERGTTQPR